MTNGIKWCIWTKQAEGTFWVRDRKEYDSANDAEHSITAGLLESVSVQVLPTNQVPSKQNKDTFI